MSNDLETKMDVIGDFYFTNRLCYKNLLDKLLKPVEIDREIIDKNEFISMFSNIYVKILYLDAFSLDFICGNKIVKIVFNSFVLKNISLTPEKGDYFKIVPSNDRRTVNIYHLVSILDNEVLLTIDFKQLNTIKISDNRITDSDIKTDSYYGGLFKIKESIEKQDEEFIPLEEIGKQLNNGSLFVNKHINNNATKTESVSSTETKKLPEDNLLLTEYNSNNGWFTLDQKSSPEFRQKCIDVINLIYNVNIKEVKIEGSVTTRHYGYLYRVCILNDGEIDYILTSSFDGEISITLNINTNIESNLKNTFDRFNFVKGKHNGR